MMIAGEIYMRSSPHTHTVAITTTTVITAAIPTRLQRATATAMALHVPVGTADLAATMVLHCPAAAARIRVVT